MDPFTPDINQYYSQEQDLPWPLESMQFDPQLQQQHQQQHQQQQQQPVSSSPFIQPIPFMSHQQQQQPYSNAIPSNINAPNIIQLDMLAHDPQHSTLTPEQQQQFLLQQQQHSQQQQQQQQFPHPPQLDANGQPIKIRKKPGRKPNPASPALRKAQNRAAQRAFRERKERHLRDLENTIRTLREQRNSAVKELATAKSKLDGCKAENWYLKGVVLTLQFVCLHHHIHIPTHSPYLTEEALADIAQTSPHAIEAYVNAYTRNNVDLKPTMATQFANLSQEDKENDDKSYQNDDTTSSQQQQRRHEQNLHDTEEDDDDMMSEVVKQELGMPGLISIPQDSCDKKITVAEATTIDPSALHHMPSLSPSPTEADDTMSKATDNDQCSVRPDDQNNINSTTISSSGNGQQQEQQPLVSSLGAIQRIRMQLRVQSALSNIGQSSTRLQPTLLQLAISHDPRIDLIPTPHMRDRMIIFRDLMDYDRCFTLLLNGAVYHGGDPTMSDSWELPAEFFSEFWYLAINYDLSKTNKWRLMKGLPELEMGPTTEGQQQQNTEEDESIWGDELLDQFTEPMPTLQPYSASRPPKSPKSPGSSSSSQNSSSRKRSPSNSPSHPMYANLRSPPELRNPVNAPSLDTMMNLMNNLSTSS